jgi:hypothetical protein
MRPAMATCETTTVGKYRCAKVAALLAVCAMLYFAAKTRAAPEIVRVDLALILAIDVSASVESSEYHAQNEGLAKALASQEVINQIRQCPLGRIAVMVVQWSGWRRQGTVVPWTVVRDETTAADVARAITTAPRQSSGWTSIAAVIDFAISQFANAPVTAPRYVLDISTDGVNNHGYGTEMPRDRAIAAGVTINGLTILTDVDELEAYFRQEIAAGSNHFVMTADDYGDYQIAIKRKLLKEIECPVLS